MSTCTITFCERAENHVGMQMIGHQINEGFTVEDLEIIQNWFSDAGAKTMLLDLTIPVIDLDIPEHDDAFFLIVRNGVDYLTSKGSSNELFEELSNLDWDKQAFMRGRVVNKKARYNLCFADFNQEPDYESKKGRVIKFKEIPLLFQIRQQLGTIINKCKNLVGEGNYYHDITTCGIGFHGDSERKIVVGIRFGETMPIVFQWFHKTEKIASPMKYMIRHGDIYFMSQKATGNDWKLRNTPTLRHAAGSKKYTG